MESASSSKATSTFETKLKQIKKSPYILRRMIGQWPYYETLQKAITGLEEMDINKLQQQYPQPFLSCDCEASPQLSTTQKLIF